jgi:hypothetical protein
MLLLGHLKNWTKVPLQEDILKLARQIRRILTNMAEEVEAVPQEPPPTTSPMDWIASLDFLLTPGRGNHLLPSGLCTDTIRQA